jgi:hypothetical protein
MITMIEDTGATDDLARYRPQPRAIGLPPPVLTPVSRDPWDSTLGAVSNHPLVAVNAQPVAGASQPVAAKDKWGNDPIIKPASEDPWAKFRKPPANTAPAKDKWGNDPIIKPASEDPRAKFRKPPPGVTPADQPTLASEAKGLGGSVARGAIGVAGTPGIVTSAIAAPGNAVEGGLSYLVAHAAEKLGLLPKGKTADELLKAVNNMGAEAQVNSPIWPSGIQRALEAVTGPLPEPKSGIGKGVGTVLEFAPQALFGAPARQVAGRLMK